MTDDLLDDREGPGRESGTNADDTRHDLVCIVKLFCCRIPLKVATVRVEGCRCILAGRSIGDADAERPTGNDN